MNPQGADLLAQLRDIHGALAEPWWPPAPGWWILAALLAATLFFIARKFLRRLRAHLRRRRLTAWVDAIERDIDPAVSPQDYLSAINRLFKLVAIEAFPDAHCARMQGGEWVEFLRRHLSPPPREWQLQVLADGPYRPAAQFEPAGLAALARQWIGQHG
jgi:hypothetical protein